MGLVLSCSDGAIDTPAPLMGKVPIVRSGAVYPYGAAHALAAGGTVGRIRQALVRVHPCYWTN